MAAGVRSFVCTRLRRVRGPMQSWGGSPQEIAFVVTAPGVVVDGIVAFGAGPYARHGLVDVELQLYDGGPGGTPSERTLLASGAAHSSQQRLITCLLGRPAALQAGREYTLVAHVSGHDTEFGCGGTRVVAAPCSVTFIFKDVRRSGNLTSFEGGQFQAVLFHLEDALESGDGDGEM